jgi:hypothetical protein
MPEPAVGPPFDSDETFGARSMTEFPVWMRPYRCRHLSAADRRARDIVIREVELG